jgi:hypothetical protein
LSANGAAVFFDQAADDGQPEPDPSAIGVALFEAIEDPRQEWGCNAAAGVGDL